MRYCSQTESYRSSTLRNAEMEEIFWGKLGEGPLLMERGDILPGKAELALHCRASGEDTPRSSFEKEPKTRRLSLP